MLAMIGVTNLINPPLQLYLLGMVSATQRPQMNLEDANAK